MRRIRCFALMLLAVPAALPAEGPLTLLTEDNPPFNYAAEGKVTGLLTELVEETARRANVPYTIELLPWDRAYARAQAERDTCLFATARLASREKLFRWIGPLASNVWGVYGKPGFPVPRRLSDLKPYRIGGVANDAKVEFGRPGDGGVREEVRAVTHRADGPTVE